MQHTNVAPRIWAFPRAGRCGWNCSTTPDYLLDWRTYQVSVTGGQFPTLLAEHPTLVSAP